MIGFSVPDWLLQVAAVLGAFTAIIAFFVTAGKTRPVQWFKKALRAEVTELIEATPRFARVEAKIDALEEKNDRQHAQNKQAIEHLTETLTEHRLETRDHLFEIRQQAKKNQEILESHFGEAKIRDGRLDQLEKVTGVNVKLTVEPTEGKGSVHIDTADVSYHSPADDEEAPPTDLR